MRHHSSAFTPGCFDEGILSKSGKNVWLGLRFISNNVVKYLTPHSSPPKFNKPLFQTHLWLVGAIVLENAPAVFSFEASQLFLE